MSSIDEKRVYGDRAGSTRLFVASGAGVVVCEVSDDLVGEFGIEYRCAARDVAADEGRVAVATDEDVLLDGDPTGFEAAMAVGFDDGALLAADEEGRVAARDDGEWSTVGETGGVRAIDPPLVAARDGVYRLRDGLEQAGLTDVRDVVGQSIPLAATADGLYTLGNGWMAERDGAFDAVSADRGRACAAGEDGLLVREDGEWRPDEVPTDERVVDVAYLPDATAAVTGGGTLLLEAGDGWRSRSLGVSRVRRLAVE